MHWPDSSHVEAALACLVLCGGLGWWSPGLVARLPEPTAEPAGEEQDTPAEPRPAGEPAADGDRRLFERTLPPAPAKELFSDIAALPRLGWWLASWSALVGAVFGLTLGWTGALIYLVPLVPIGVVLVLIDWRTTLLPTRIIRPTYVALAHAKGHPVHTWTV